MIEGDRRERLSTWIMTVTTIVLLLSAINNTIHDDLKTAVLDLALGLVAWLVAEL